MKWVDQATCRPYRCAIVPYVGNGRGNLFIDTGVDFDMEHVYVSDVAAEYLASEMLGWVRPQQLDKVRGRVVELEGEVESLKAQLVEADLFADAIDGLTKKGMVVRKQPGRKPWKKKEEEVEV